MAPRKHTRAEVVDRVALVFRDHGYEGATLSRISEATDLGRASLYHHFPGGKEDMGRAVLERVAVQLAEPFDALSGDGTPEERLAGFLRGVDAFYEKGKRNCLLGAMVLSGGHPRFAEELSARFKEWVDGLAAVSRASGHEGREARRRAEDAVARIQGGLVVARGLGKGSIFKRTLAELPEYLLA
ncbi:MAG: TetR/AcrR family transcriptional regulator [Myxococcota bacterium]